MSYGFGLNAYDYNQPNGMAQFIFSDILGDHKIYFASETNIDSLSEFILSFICFSASFF